jgi:hypothetical protein
VNYALKEMLVMTFFRIPWHSTEWVGKPQKPLMISNFLAGIFWPSFKILLALSCLNYNRIIMLLSILKLL